MTIQPTEHERADLIRLGKEAMDLLRRAQTLDAELSASKATVSTDARVGMIERKNSLLRQRFTVKAKAKEIHRAIDDRKRTALIDAVGHGSPTALLKQAWRRSSVLEALYLTLYRHLENDGEVEDFDWRLSVRKAQHELLKKGLDDRPDVALHDDDDDNGA